MKINMPKRTAAQLRKRESDLLEELCTRHGYMFSDTLPKRDRETMLVAFDRRRGKKLKLDAGIVIKLTAPASSALGVRIMEMRKNEKRGKPRKPRKP